MNVMRGSHCNQENFRSEREVRDSHLSQVVEEPFLSAAHVRNFVKQLTLVAVKDSMNQKEHLGSSQQAQPPQPRKRKKPIRRRLLTSGPYKENPLDMAVARREIVTELRIHRACMNQNRDNHLQTPHQTHSASSSRATQPQHKWKSKSRESSNLYDFSTTHNFSNNLNNLSYQSFPYQPPQTSYPWPMYAPPPMPEISDLPNRTLGLKLNLQDFDGLDTSVLQNNYIPAPGYTSIPVPCYTSTSPSTSNSLPLIVAREETPSVGLSQALVADPGVEGDLGLHHAVDGEEMSEIRSVGEKHQIEWDDTINMVTSAWWSDFLNTKENDTNRFGTEFPPWLNSNDNCFQQLDEPSEYFQDPTPTLPQ